MKKSPAAGSPTQPSYRINRVQALACLLLACLLLSLLSLALGARAMSLTSLLDYLRGTNLNPADQAVFSQRALRTLTAGLVGAALGLAGAGIQGITRNPLGDPGILGINAGAACAVVCAISFAAADSTADFALWAFIGALASALAVYALASLGPAGPTPIKLALMGAALSAGLGAISSALILTDQNSLDNLRRWQVGTVAGSDLSDLAVAGPLLALGAGILLTGARTINSLALGDDMASALGERVALRRLLLTLAVTLLVGTSLALAGPIAFLGLMAPHLMRSLIGVDYRFLLPYSALAGAALLILADTLGRSLVRPQEMPVGIMMVLLGAPLFIYLVRRGKAVNL